MTKRNPRHRIPPAMTTLSRSLRRESTHPERALWDLLRVKQLAGLRVRRQHVVGPYIVDFYCPSAKLVIELDGESHDGRLEYDAKRTSHLEKLGLKVFRVTNDEVLEDPDAVAEAILHEVELGRN